MFAVHFRRKYLPLLVIALVLAFPGVVSAGIGKGPMIPPNVAAKFKKYDTKYYVIFSDLPPEQVETVSARITAVAEDFYQLTKTLGSGKITSRWPLYVIGNRQDYAAAGGEAFGCAWADRLMALVDATSAPEIWHVIQHEVFHQFVHTVVSDKVAGWVDEGLAEYYGEAPWTGDGIAPGVIPPKRYTRFVPAAKDGRIKPFKDIIMIKNTDWQGIESYDQGLTMVHFFLHGQNGKYQKSFYAYLKMTGAGAPYDAAFAKCFGKNIDAFQKEYLDWVTGGMQAVSDRAYTQAAVATLTSFLGRAWSQGQKFATFEEFLAAAKDGSGLKQHPKQPLPDELLADALKRAEGLKTWSLDVPKTGLPKIVLTLDDGTVMTASCTLKDGKVESTKVDVKTAKTEGKP